MFSGICAALAEQAARRCNGDFLKEKGQIIRLPKAAKDTTPKKYFLHQNLKCFYFDFYPKTESSSQWSFYLIRKKMQSYKSIWDDRNFCFDQVDQAVENFSSGFSSMKMNRWNHRTIAIFFWKKKNKCCENRQ